MGIPEGLSRHSGQEKSGMDLKFFEEGQLLDLVEAENHNEGNVEYVQLEELHVFK